MWPLESPNGAVSLSTIDPKPEPERELRKALEIGLKTLVFTLAFQPRLISKVDK